MGAGLWTQPNDVYSEEHTLADAVYDVAHALHRIANAMEKTDE